MSYQYPPPPQDGADMDLPHASYISSYATPSASSMEGATDPDNGHMALSSSEKRRNKLGYHRTSVACGMFYTQALSLLYSEDISHHAVVLLTPPPKAIAGVEKSDASYSLLILAVDA
ncbi:uncharacterized protein PG986_006858 [Apiospora aurea]|uniref:Uncharacterized protein n=1 Tax=Apiospora aurea TaxID=335848 RepID=A0ABR1QAX0_9PEZI